jgi:hypothetical protein
VISVYELPLSSHVVAAGLIAGIFLAASLISNLRFFKEIQRRQMLMRDSGAVEVIEVEASRVLDIEPLGSHGPALCFFMGEGKALLLIGQWLLEASSFPSTAFRLHRWSDTKTPIRIESRRGPITPENSAAQLPGRYNGGDVALFDAMPDTLQQDLDKAFGG